jgi:hypothetical protein
MCRNAGLMVLLLAAAGCGGQIENGGGTDSTEQAVNAIPASCRPGASNLFTYASSGVAPNDMQYIYDIPLEPNGTQCGAALIWVVSGQEAAGAHKQLNFFTKMRNKPMHMSVRVWDWNYNLVWSGEDQSQGDPGTLSDYNALVTPPLRFSGARNESYIVAVQTNVAGKIGPPCCRHTIAEVGFIPVQAMIQPCRYVGATVELSCAPIRGWMLESLWRGSD